MSVRAKIGDLVRVNEEDCCIGFCGMGIVEAIKYASDDSALDEDDIESVTIGGITLTGAWPGRIAVEVLS